MALTELAHDPGADYGEVFTRRWVVDLILDLVGYTPDEDLGAQTLVEPSCGTGAFLVPVVDRLIESSARPRPRPASIGPAASAHSTYLRLNAAARSQGCRSERLEEALNGPQDEAEALVGGSG